MKRDSRGRIIPGTHWREPKPFWEKAWLEREYLDAGRSARDIAAPFGLGETAILYWLDKHGIPRRSISEARKLKHWGSSGADNPMFGRTGPRNPNWNGGLTPARQAIYTKARWKTVAGKVRRRDKTCRLCGEGEMLEIHHIERFGDAPLLAMDAENLILLCKGCHKRVSRRSKWWRRRLLRLVKEVS